MRNLLNLLQKYSSVILFLLLQAICFSFVFSNYNTYHHIAFANSSNAIVGGIYSINSSISDYFHLKEDNAKLVEENLEQKRKLIGHNIIMGDKFISFDDTIYLQQYQYIDGKVINSSINRQKNSLTLNRGLLSGVDAEMGVFGTKGVIGITISSGNYYSTVVPIINETFEMSVRHKKTKSFGMLKWTKDNTWETATIVDIPNYIDILKGDTIESRGSDGFFPEGILVGKVLKTEPVKGTSYQKIEIKLAEDFSTIYDVTIVKNILQYEQKEIEKEE